MSLEDATSLIRGIAGTSISLEIMRDGGERSVVKLVRDVVVLEEFEFSKSLLGKPIPDFEFSYLEDGSKGKISDFKGKIVVIDVWGTLCAPCQKPMDQMQNYRAKNPGWRDKVELIGASVHTTREVSLDHAKKKGWNRTTNIHLDDEVSKQLGVVAIPLLIVLKPDGEVIYYGDIHGASVPDIVNGQLGSDAN